MEVETEVQREKKIQIQGIMNNTHKGEILNILLHYLECQRQAAGRTNRHTACIIINFYISVAITTIAITLRKY